jgi:Tol biopolymer transport system component
VSGAPPRAPSDDLGAPARGTTGPATDLPIRPPADPDLALGAPPPGTTSLISLDRNDGPSNGASAQASISANGRWVAFASSAADLVNGDTNRAVDVFVRDRRTGDTIRLPIPGGGQVAPGGYAQDPSISADGAVVAFVHKPPAGAVLVDASQPVVVAWVRATGATEIVSFAPNGEIARGSGEPSVSGDGRFVAFSSVWLVGNEDETDDDVFVRDRKAGSTALVSAALDGDPGASASRAPAISRDGRIVAFESDAADLVAGDANGQTDVFARDVGAGRTEMISVVAGGESNGPSQAPSISGNGSRVAFESAATNLVAGAPAVRSVYLRDRAAGTTTLVSAGIGGAAPQGLSGQPSISDDGRIVAFASTAPNIVALSGNAVLAALVVAQAEVFARDMVSGETIRISEARAGGKAGGQNIAPSVGGNGRYVAWSSNSPALVDGDANKLGDVFLRDLPPVISLAPPVLDFGTRAIGVAGPPLAAIMTNDGWGPLTGRGTDRDGAAAADFAVVFDGCLGRILHRTESCAVTVTFTPAAKNERVAGLLIAHDGPRSPAKATLRGGGSLALLELDPPVGPPGMVTIVTGSGFPPNTEVTLAWSRGVTPKLPTITTDADGAFRVQVLIFHNDIVGARDLVVSARNGTAFAPFGTAFAVASASSQPPRFIGVDPYGDWPPTLVMRR